MFQPYKALLIICVVVVNRSSSVDSDDTHHEDLIVQFAIEPHESTLEAERGEPCCPVQRDGFGIGCIDPEINLPHSGYRTRTRQSVLDQLAACAAPACSRCNVHSPEKRLVRELSRCFAPQSEHPNKIGVEPRTQHAATRSCNQALRTTSMGVSFSSS